MKTQKLDRKRARIWRVVSTILLLAVGLVALQRNWSTVLASLTLVRHASADWIGLAVLLMVLTFCLASAVYGLLALHPLRYAQTVLVEIAAAFVGRLLPAGLGGLGLNGVYLYRRQHTVAEATAVTSVNNVIGMCVHVVLVCLLLVFRPQVATLFLRREHIGDTWIWVAGLVCMVMLLFVLPVVRRRITHFTSNLLVSVRKERLKSVLCAAALSCLITVSYTFILFCASRAVGVTLNPYQLFIAFTVGVFVGTITPAPGGLVGTEAGLYSALVGFGAQGSSAAAAVVIFRLVTYWLPILPGALALGAARSKKLV